MHALTAWTQPLEISNPESTCSDRYRWSLGPGHRKGGADVHVSQAVFPNGFPSIPIFVQLPMAVLPTHHFPELPKLDIAHTIWEAAGHAQDIPESAKDGLSCGYMIEYSIIQ
jgi:hypothetical protein